MAGFSDDSDVVSGVDLEVETLEDPLLQTRWIAEPDILELDLALEARWVHINCLVRLVDDTINIVLIRS